MSALLVHEAVGGPIGDAVIESLIGSAERELGGIVQCCGVKVIEIAQGHRIRGGYVAGHHPGETSAAIRTTETAGILKDEYGVSGNVGLYRGPVDRQALNAEEEEEGVAVPAHVRGRALVGVIDVVEIGDEPRGARGGGGASPQVAGTGIFHNRELKLPVARLDFRFYYKASCILVAALPVPVDDHASHTAREHVIDLSLNDGRICRLVADIHVVAEAEPRHKVRIYLRGRARVQELRRWHFADVPICRNVAVWLSRK